MEKSRVMDGRKMEMIINNKSKVDHGSWDSVDHDSTSSDHVEGSASAAAAGVFPWPPRSYTCSFCKRQFRSAQALGGHMNIHRRDRARLRQSPPPPRDIGHGQFSFLNLNLEPNPNLNFNTNPNSTKSPPIPIPPPFTSRLPSFFAPSNPPPPPLPVISEMRGWGTKEGMISQTHKASNFGKIRATKRVLDHHQQLGNMSSTAISLKDGKRSEFVRLELEIGLLGEENEDLDLELRLGYT